MSQSLMSQSRMNAEHNLKEFGDELKLKDLTFDENHTCILGIDDQFSLHLTFEPNSHRLYLYSPLLDGLPTTDALKLKLFETLLEGSMLGGMMAGGGVGLAPKEELVLLHCTLSMEHADARVLRSFAPLYVETVEKWREVCKDIKEGRKHTLPTLPDAGSAVKSKAPAGGMRA